MRDDAPQQSHHVLVRDGNHRGSMPALILATQHKYNCNFSSYY